MFPARFFHSGMSALMIILLLSACTQSATPPPALATEPLPPESTTMPPTVTPGPPASTPTPSTPTPQPSASAIPEVVTPGPADSQGSTIAADLLAKADAAANEAHSARVSLSETMTSPGGSVELTCDGVAEQPVKAYLKCEVAGTRYETVVLSQTDGFLRQANSELWLKLPRESLSNPLDSAGLDIFGRDVQVLGEKTIDGVPCYLVQSSVDLGKLFSSQPQTLQTLNLQQSSGTVKAWIGKQDYLLRRTELSMNLTGSGWELESTTIMSQGDFDKPVTIPEPNPYAAQITMSTSDPVYQVAFSPDSQVLAAADDDAFIYLWSTSDPDVNGRYIDHPQLLTPSDSGPRFISADFYALAFSPDNRVLATGTEGEVLMYALDDLEAKPVSLPVAKGAQIRALTYSPDSKYLAAGGDNHLVYVWQTANPAAAATILKGHTGPIRDLVFLPSGKTLASASEDKTILLWDMLDLAAQPQVLSGHKMPVYDLAVSADGRILLSAGFKDPVYAWSLEKPGARPKLLIPSEDAMISKAPTLAIALSPDGEMLATSEVFGQVRLWAAPDFDRPYATFATGYQDDIMSLSFSPDGRYLSAGQGSNMVHIWDLKPEMTKKAKEPVAAADASGLTVEEVLDRNKEAMENLQSVQITMTLDATEPGRSGGATPTAARAMTVTASVSLPEGAQTGLTVSGVTKQTVRLADGRVVTIINGAPTWEGAFPGTDALQSHDYLALGQAGHFAHSPEFAGTTSVAGQRAYVVKFAVSPREFFKAEPMLAERFGGTRVQITGEASIGQDDFLTRRVIYKIVLKTPHVDSKAEYRIDLGAFNEAVHREPG